MTGGMEAVGDVGTGAIWARAVEPGTGDAHAAGHGACLNCGAALIGRYCHACGQSSHVHRTLMSIVHDLAHGVFHFEGKIWRTVPMLVLRPGALTRRYIAGERAKFVSPLALFLFTVFLMFATISALSSSDLAKGFEKGWAVPTASIDTARARAAESLAAASRERAALVAAGQPTAAIDKTIAEYKDEAASLAKVRAKLAEPDEDRLSVHSSWGWLDDAIQRARANPSLVVYKVQSAAYKYSWALIFLSTPLVALLFLWRRRYGLYDHATFVTYSLSFMSLLMIAMQLFGAAGVPQDVAGCLVFAVPIHMFMQLRGAYALGWFSALWRTVALLALSSVALSMFVLGVIVLEVSH